jgi:FkbM family methyltransferase
VRRVYGSTVFEIGPVAEYANDCRERFKVDQSVTVVPAALGERSGVTYLIPAEDGSSSWIVGSGSIQVDVIDVAEFVGKHPIGLLKINAEGAENEVLAPPIETKSMWQFGSILAQFHKFVPDSSHRRRSIRQQLRHTHRCVLNVT